MRDIFHDGPDSYDIRQDLHIDPGDDEDDDGELIPGNFRTDRYIECPRCGCRMFEPRFWSVVECPACGQFLHNEE